MVATQSAPPAQSSPWKRALIVVAFCSVLVCGASLAYFGCNPSPSVPATEPVPKDLPADESKNARISFRDLARVAGINFKHMDSPSDMHYVPEIMGGGAAWIDYDQDGYMD